MGTDRHEAEAWGGPLGRGGSGPPLALSLPRFRGCQAEGPPGRSAGASVGPPAVAVVGRLAGLGLLRDGAGLATLPAARLQGWGGEERGAG